MPDEGLRLRSILQKPMSDGPTPAEEDTELPSLQDRQYVPHARPANKPLYSIHFVNAAGDVHSFQYVHLDSNSAYSAGCITLKFLGMEPVRVVIRGRNLWRLYDLIHQHRIAWIMQAAQDFARDGQTIISQVSFAMVKEED